MNLLLDTHILLWSLAEPGSLSPKHRAAIESPDNEVWVSAVSIWEIVIKTQTGKLRLPEGLSEAIAEQSFRPMPLIAEHCFEVRNLPTHHRDPFDRALIAQARVERMHLVTLDKKLELYGDLVPLLPS